MVISLEEGWAELKAGVDKFLRILDEGCRTPFTPKEFLALYTTCYTMCTQKAPDNHAHELYARYGMIYEEYLTAVVLPSIHQKRGEVLLDEFALRWRNHKLMVRHLANLFVYLDRFHVKRMSVNPLKEVGVMKFQQIIFDLCHGAVKDAVLELIERERGGELVDREKIRSVVNVFVEIGDWRPLFPIRAGEEVGDIGSQALSVYSRLFEEPLLKATAQFYARESSRWIDDDSCPEYLKKVESRLAEELERCASYLHNSTEEKLLQTTLHELLATHQTRLMDKENSGAEALLRENKVEDLARMYSLLLKLPPNDSNVGLPPLGTIVRRHITDVGLALVKKEAMEKEHSGYIRLLLDLHAKYVALVSQAFSDNPIFQKVLKEAFEAFVNKDVGSSSTAELLSNFCDSLLRGTTEKVDSEIDSWLDRVVALFSFLGDKDIFAEFYRKQLAKRLLFGKSQSDDNERAFIAKLKHRCGAIFTSKMEGMITDITTSGDTQAHFSTWMKETNCRLGLDLTVTVLTTGHWPSYQADNIVLPNELSACVDAFARFYGSRTAHRKLQWVHTLGSCSLQGYFGKKKFDLMLSTYQGAILLLFNQQESFTFKEIALATKLSPDPLKRCLESFTSKTKILNKDPPKPTEHADSHVYSFNNEFDDARRRINMCFRVTKVTADEKAATKTTVDEDRKHAVEACIVRVMKSRRTLDHQQLILTVSEQLMPHFKPDPKVIKRRIEDLIAREYLERDKDNQGIYLYVA